jgi:oxygen-independent coproporphyrinogen-3 oxidase
MERQFQSIDIGILRKYDKPGPRYTSYPTAPIFTHEFGPDQLREEIILTNGDGAHSDISLYIHFPFCDTLCYFCGCTMLVTHSRERIKEYNEYVKKEISLIHPLISSSRHVTQLHWGGGTPSYLEPDEITDMSSFVRNNFTLTQDIEASVEIDPRGLTFKHMKALHDGGFNRVSMGVQDLNKKVQAAVNRLQPEKMTRTTIDWCRTLGFSSINLDLIYGLPFQTLASFEKTIDTIIDISPDRIAVFNYAHVPWLKPHMKLIHPENLPTLEIKLQILKMTIEKLTEAGYWYIGMDHFAKPGDDLSIAQKNKTLYRNFQGYSTKAGTDVYAFGMSSISQFTDIYAQNVKTLPEYYQRIGSGKYATQVGYRMTRDDHIRKFVITKLMCEFEIDKNDIEHRFGIPFDSYFTDGIEKLDEFIADGFVVNTPDAIVVRGMGRLIIRNIAMCFDAYLEKMMKERPIFSRTV